MMDMSFRGGGRIPGAASHLCVLFTQTALGSWSIPLTPFLASGPAAHSVLMDGMRQR